MSESYQLLGRMWSNQNLHALPVECKLVTITLETVWQFLKSEACTYHMTQQERSRGKDTKGMRRLVGVKGLLITFTVVMVHSCTPLLKLIKLCTLIMHSL